MIGKKRFKRVYIEITSVCNLNCKFCPKTNREAKFLSVQEFDYIIKEIKDYTDYVYFHVMGEPLLNPNLSEFFKICERENLKVNLVTNGTLLPIHYQKLNSNALRKITISLHSFEANDQKFANYYENSIKIAKILSRNAIVELRLWNNNSKLNKNNDLIFNLLENKFSVKIDRNANNQKLADNIFLGRDSKFSWPNLKSDFYSEMGTCLGLREQIAILSDGTVVPCCLDSDGEINLGNIFKTHLPEILNSIRAKNIYNGFLENKKIENLCRHCNFKDTR